VVVVVAVGMAALFFRSSAFHLQTAA
jgi:hypothetical protein